MAQSRVVVLNETKKEYRNENSADNGWTLCFQYCRYEYGDEERTQENGYRFIWRRPNGNLQGARGQARIPSVSVMLELISNSINEGWGHHIERGGGFELE